MEPPAPVTSTRFAAEALAAGGDRWAESLRETRPVDGLADASDGRVVVQRQADDGHSDAELLADAFERFERTQRGHADEPRVAALSGTGEHQPHHHRPALGQQPGDLGRA